MVVVAGPRKTFVVEGETMKINGEGSKSVRGRNIIRCQQLIIVFLLKQKNCIRQNNNFRSFLSRSNSSPRRLSRVARFLCVQLSPRYKLFGLSLILAVRFSRVVGDLHLHLFVKMRELQNYFLGTISFSLFKKKSLEWYF